MEQKVDRLKVGGDSDLIMDIAQHQVHSVLPELGRAVIIVA